MGNSPRHCGPNGQWVGFISIWWGIVIMGSCPRTVCVCGFVYLCTENIKLLILSETLWSLPLLSDLYALNGECAVHLCSIRNVIQKVCKVYDLCKYVNKVYGLHTCTVSL